MAIKTSEIVVDDQAPDHVQHMATDINNALARLSKGTNDDLTALEARIAALEAVQGQYGR